MSMTAELETDELNLDERALCPDESCVGVLGPEGRCKTCGLGQDGARAAPESEAAEDRDPYRGEIDTAWSAGWDDRRLCSDGSCVGLVGVDDRCATCGRAA